MRLNFSPAINSTINLPQKLASVKYIMCTHDIDNMNHKFYKNNIYHTHLNFMLYLLTL